MESAGWVGRGAGRRANWILRKFDSRIDGAPMWVTLTQCSEKILNSGNPVPEGR
jgi:hypothetical protein